MNPSNSGYRTVGRYCDETTDSLSHHDLAISLSFASYALLDDPSGEMSLPLIFPSIKLVIQMGTKWGSEKAGKGRASSTPRVTVGARSTIVAC